jgi:hypothetical protein
LDGWGFFPTHPKEVLIIPLDSITSKNSIEPIGSFTIGILAKLKLAFKKTEQLVTIENPNV